MIDNLVRAGDKPKLACILSNRVPVVDDDRDYGDDSSFADHDDYLTLYTGKTGEYVWMPSDRNVLTKIINILGKEKIKSIEKYHRDNKSITGHKYRGGEEKKNRHHHSDDKPWSGHRYSFISYSGHTYE